MEWPQSEVVPAIPGIRPFFDQGVNANLVRISRLYLAVELVPQTTLELDEASAHYVRNVLRLSNGHEITLFNGDGVEYAAKLTLVSRRSVIVRIDEGRVCDCESSLKIHLALGISRSERMDLAIQKSVELGVNTIVPLITERCVVKFTNDRREQKQQHWQKVVQHACEQCGRSVLPSVAEPQVIEHWLPDASGFKLFLDPRADATLKQHTLDCSDVWILSGPEGGFSPGERAKVTQAGFKGVRLGPRILRTETAALTAISVVQALWGDLL